MVEACPSPAKSNQTWNKSAKGPDGLVEHCNKPVQREPQSRVKWNSNWALADFVPWPHLDTLRVAVMSYPQIHIQVTDTLDQQCTDRKWWSRGQHSAKHDTSLNRLWMQSRLWFDEPEWFYLYIIYIYIWQPLEWSTIPSIHFWYFVSIHEY